MAQMTKVEHFGFLATLGMTGGSEYFMRVATLTTWNENGVGSPVL